MIYRMLGAIAFLLVALGIAGLEVQTTGFYERYQ
jgi:hypothetical protein